MASRRRSSLAALSAVLVLACTGRPPPPAYGPGEGYAGLSSDYERGPSAGMREVSVTMYMTTWCPHCRRAQAWLEAKGYRFEMRDVDRDDEAAAILSAINPRGAVPTFDVGGQVVFGFEPGRLEAAIRRAAGTR